MNICCFTTNAPCGKGEEFVLREIKQLAALGNKTAIFPVRPLKPYTSGEFDVIDCTRATSAKNFKRALGFFFRHPKATISAVGGTLIHSGNIKNAVKNLIVSPRALVCADIILKDGAYDFIYANWLATTSSAALITAKICKLPLGITAHRFDVYEHNAIAYKAGYSEFIRIIDQKGTNKVLSEINEKDSDKIHCIHLGVDIPAVKPAIPKENKSDKLVIATPAHLIPIKGHRYIIEAAAMLKKQGKAAEFRFYGCGDAEAELKGLCNDYGVADSVVFCGYINNAELLEKYASGEITAVLLASVWLGGNEHEGIPVCLMEAMAYGVPVIATSTGGIPELLDNGAGILIPDKDAQSICSAVMRLMTDSELNSELSENGYKRVCSEFNNNTCTNIINSLMHSACKGD